MLEVDGREPYAQLRSSSRTAGSCSSRDSRQPPVARHDKPAEALRTPREELGLSGLGGVLDP
jgi:hypothetical protein